MKILKNNLELGGNQVYNDTEIKIFDYLHKKYEKVNGKKVIDLKTVFSDKATCQYCQDVVRRIRKAEKSEVNLPSKQYLDLSDGIFANFKLGNVNGKPFYMGDVITQEKVKLIEDIFDGKEICN